MNWCMKCPMMLVTILCSPLRHTVTMARLCWRVINAGKQSDLCRNRKNVSVIETGSDDDMSLLFCHMVFILSLINLRFYLSPGENPAHFQTETVYYSLSYQRLYFVTVLQEI